jgi:hypothetical protein
MNSNIRKDWFSLIFLQTRKSVFATRERKEENKRKGHKS